LLCTIAVALFALATVGWARRGRPPVFLGFYILYVGILFLLSYFYSHASYVLSMLM